MTPGPAGGRGRGGLAGGGDAALQGGRRGPGAAPARPCHPQPSPEGASGRGLQAAAHRALPQRDLAGRAVQSGGAGARPASAGNGTFAFWSPWSLARRLCQAGGQSPPRRSDLGMLRYLAAVRVPLQVRISADEREADGYPCTQVNVLSLELLLSKHGQSFWINHRRDALLFCHRLCWQKGCKYLGLEVVWYLHSSSSRVRVAPHQLALCDWQGQQESM